MLGPSPLHGFAGSVVLRSWCPGHLAAGFLANLILASSASDSPSHQAPTGDTILQPSEGLQYEMKWIQVRLQELFLCVTGGWRTEVWGDNLPECVLGAPLTLPVQWTRNSSMIWGNLRPEGDCSLKSSDNVKPHFGCNFKSDRIVNW